MEGMTLTFSATTKSPRKTCVPCRQRKVRCSNKKPGVPPCDNCRRLKFDCYFRSKRAGQADSGDGPFAKPEPRRVSKACVRCREHKIRCSGGVPCATCLKRSALCEYMGDPAESRHELSPPNQATAGRASESTLGQEGATTHVVARASDDGDSDGEGGTMNRGAANHPVQSAPPSAPDIPMLIAAFFKHVYPLPSYSFLHPKTIMRKYADGTIEKSLVNAIAAISSVRAPGIQRYPSLESAWVQEAETLVWQHLESPSIARLQAILLVILYRAETGQLRRAFMLASLAGRASMAMRLNHERPGPSTVSLEVRRRLLWSLKLAERYFSVGLPEFELCPVENIYIQLPCTEYQFGTGAGTTTATSTSEWDIADDKSSYHVSVKLEMFRRDVMKLNRSLALFDQPFPQLPKLIDDFQQHLDRIGGLLPDGPNPSWAQLEDALRNTWLPRHLMVRLSFHQTHIDLYRLLLRNYRDAAPDVVIDAMDDELRTRAEVLCVHHAKMAVQTIASLDGILTEDPPRLIEFDTAICAYTASRMLLFTARFGRTSERPSEEFALSRAELCLAVVRRFFPRSMLVRPIIDELRRLISVFATEDTPPPSRFSSPKPQPSSSDRDPVTQLSSAARIRQRLAIHSLLRQAKFVDDVDEMEMDDGPTTSVDQSTSDTSAVIFPSTETDASGMTSLSPGPSMQTRPELADKKVAPLPALTKGDGSLATSSPDTQGDNEPWTQWFFEGGDPLQDPATEMAPSFGLNQRSFTFPWLQREESDLGPRNAGW